MNEAVRPAPSLADRDSPAAVIFIAVVLWVPATLAHRTVGAKLIQVNGTGTSRVTRILLASRVSVAAATLLPTANEQIASCRVLVSALADTKPSALAPFVVASKRDDFQETKAATS